jgi:hypothetical protein
MFQPLQGLVFPSVRARIGIVRIFVAGAIAANGRPLRLVRCTTERRSTAAGDAGRLAEATDLGQAHRIDAVQ